MASPGSGPGKDSRIDGCWKVGWGDEERATGGAAESAGGAGGFEKGLRLDLEGWWLPKSLRSGVRGGSGDQREETFWLWVGVRGEIDERNMDHNPEGGGGVGRGVPGESWQREGGTDVILGSLYLPSI